MTDSDFRSNFYIVDLDADEIMNNFFAQVFGSPALIQTPEVPPMKTLLVSFVFGNSSTNGIIMGTRQELPNKVKESRDFPGTFYKIVTDDHGQKRVYRYVPLAQVANFLEDTETGSRVLEKVLTPEELDEVMTPEPGEVWQTESGERLLVIEGGRLVDQQGRVSYLGDWECDVERIARTATFA